MSANNHQVGGDHYRRKSIQPWDAMKAWMSHEAFMGFLLGCVIKRLGRWQDKDGLQDLKKAHHELGKAIEERVAFEHEQARAAALDALAERPNVKHNAPRSGLG